MAILRSDVRLMKSERLTDNEDGGGRMIGEEVIDGVANNLFPDISRLDRVYGRVSMRKAFLSVNTSNSDTYYGAHAIVSNPPEDDLVHTLLFTTKSSSDERQEAQSRIESYVVKSYKTGLKLLTSQLSGQASIVCFADPKTEKPAIGDVIVLTEGVKEQFVRIIDMSYETRVFNYDTGGSVGSFTADKITLELNQLLTQDFTGNEPHPTSAAVTSIFATTVANAARYYGVSRLQEPATVGKKELKIDTIFKPIVPATNKESVIVDKYPFIDDTAMMAIGSDVFTKSLGNSTSTGKTFYIGVGVMPGSLRVTQGSTVYRDNVSGSITPVNPANDIGVTGYVEYTSGKLFLQGGSSGTAVSVTCTPAANIGGDKVTFDKEITVANIAFNHTFNTVAETGYFPAVGSVLVDFMSFGKWYRLYDNSQGGLVGLISGVGAGTIDYVTGSIVITCSALPDIGSYIIVTCAPSNNSVERITPAFAFAGIKHNFIHNAIKPGTVGVSWKNKAGATVSSTASASGFFSGNATGECIFTQTKILNSDDQEVTYQPYVNVVPTAVPDTTVPITLTYTEGSAAQVVNFQYTNAPDVGLNKLLVIDTGATNLVPGTVSMRARIRRPSTQGPGGVGYYESAFEMYTDDGQGGLYHTFQERVWVYNYNSSGGLYSYNNNANYYVRKTALMPSAVIDYVAGTISINFYQSWSYSYTMLQSYDSGFGYTNTYRRETYTYGFEAWDGTAFVSAYSGGDAGDSHSVEIPWPLPTFTLTTPRTEVKPGSVRVQVGSTVLYDKSGGQLQHTIDATTGVGTKVGSVDYASGKLTFDNYNLFGASTLTAPTGISMLVQDGLRHPVTNVTFRTTGAPLVPSSLTVSAYNYDDSEAMGLTVDEYGEFSSTFDDLLTGKVQYDIGLVKITCGSTLDEDDRPVFQSKLYAPQISYNAVYRQNLPLDAILLGLDPTKLPLDGRIPIFRKADVIVVHHTDTYQCAEPAAGQTFNVGRTRLALVEVYDANDTVMATEDYNYDLTAGTVTFVPTFSVAYTEPLRIQHRIEDMLLVTEVYINGKLETAGAISHEFPADETQVSSALLFGDLASRVLKLFSQVSWTSVWSDARIGSNTTAQFNDLQFPIAVTNEQAIQERWALVFTSSTGFTINGETLGQIGTGTTGGNCAPINPLTSKPYFTLDYRAWGTGWATGNVLRFNTQAASAPMWLARTTLAGPVEEPVDKFILQLRGDAN